MVATSPSPALLVSSVLGRTLAGVDAVIARLTEQHGELGFISDQLSFEWTSFYADELGPDPARRIIAFSGLTDTSSLPEIKRATCRMEVALARPGAGRQVNIDPGILGVEQLVVASTKHRAHRIHLGRGIYADLMLIHRRGGFSPLPWTYPDYASQPLLDIFNRLRLLLLEKYRQGSGA